jgi:hypothetical protein
LSVKSPPLIIFSVIDINCPGRTSTELLIFAFEICKV